LPASDKDASSLACAWKRHAAGIALGTVVGALAYLGLAIFGWGGFGDFFSHPARVVLAVTVVVLAGAAPFTRGNLSPGVREDHIYLNEVDWYFDDLRRKTAQGPYEAINYHRFADDTVITISGHWSKRGWAERALQRLQEQLEARSRVTNGAGLLPNPRPRECWFNAIRPEARLRR
jgi:hypothetical protein